MAQTFKKTAKSRDGINLYYETYITEGQPPTVFFIHGAGGDVDAWQYVRDELLPRGFSSLAMDLRGHGYSSHPRSFASYHMDNFVQDIAAILEQEKIDTVFLAGHSFGATVALCFALRYPEKLKGLVVISGTYGPPRYLSSPALLSFNNLIIAGLAFVSPPPICPGHSRYPPGKFHKDYEWFGLARTILRNSWRSYLLTNKEIFTPELEPRLDGITVPTLVIVGTKDSIFPLAISENIHKKIKGSKFAAIPEANHVLILNNIPQISTLLDNFFRETANRRM